MRQIAVDSMLFFIAFNCACFAIVSMTLLTTSHQGIDPRDMPFRTDFTNIFGDVTLIAGTITTGITAAISLLTGHNIIGYGLIGLLALQWFIGPINWVIFGLPKMLQLFAVPESIQFIVGAIYAFIWVLFAVEFIGGRDT